MSSGMNRVKFDDDLQYGFSNKEASGNLPNPLPESVLLNLGCGNDIREGFINIDLYSNDPRVVFGDVRQLALPNNSADLILASDILEHFSHRETQAILSEWARVLKPNGEIIIRCPSLKLQTQAYVNGIWNADIASYMIFGGQTNPGDYHCVAFDETSIKDKLHKAGFLITEYLEEDVPQDQGYINLNMTVRAKKKQVHNEIFADYPIPPSIFNTNVTEKVENVPTQTVEAEDSSDDDSLFDISMLEDMVDRDNKSVEHTEKGIDTKQQLNVVWEGSQFVWHSLALINREHCSNLIDANVANVTIIPYEPDAFAADASEKYRKLKSNDIRFKEDVSDEVSGLPYIWIRHQWPPKAEPPKGAKWVIMQPWEYTEHRADFVEIFKQAEEIWTPSNFSRQSFINSGILPDKVQVIPNGIDPILFTPKGNKYPLKTNKKIKFLYVGGTIYRKGFDILLDAYLSTFNRESECVLVVKDMGGDSFYKGQTAKKFIIDAQANPNTPEIIYIEDTMTEEEIASLYRACDVFVSPYRGEGFSLPTLEAMACGLPVVVTEGGATDDFTDFDCAWYIPSEKVSIGSHIDNLPLTGEAYLLEPNKQELAETLKYIEASPTKIFSSGIIASAMARKERTWKSATMKLLKRIDYLCNTDMAKKAYEKFNIETDSLIEFGLAEKEFVGGKYEKAEELFQKMTTLNELDDKYKLHIFNRLAQIALIYERIGDADNYLSKAKNISSYNIDSMFVESQILSQKQMNTEAFEMMTELFDKWGEQKYNGTIGMGLDDMMTFCGDIALSEEDLEGAHQYYTASLKINPRNAAACYGAGLCFEKIGHNDAADTMFDWAEKLNPDYRRP